MNGEHDDRSGTLLPAPPFASRRLFVLIALLLAAIVAIFSVTWAAVGIGVLVIWYGTLWIENVDKAHLEILHRLDRLEHSHVSGTPTPVPRNMSAHEDDDPAQLELPN